MVDGGAPCSRLGSSHPWEVTGRGFHHRRTSNHQPPTFTTTSARAYQHWTIDLQDSMEATGWAGDWSTFETGSKYEICLHSKPDTAVVEQALADVSRPIFFRCISHI